LQEGTLSVFPNPSNNVMRITYNIANIKSVEILDMTGRFIADHKVDTRFDAIIPTTSLIDGTYIAKVNLEDGSFLYAKFQVFH